MAPASIEQEGRVILAIQAYKSGAIPSIRRAAEAYDVPKETLRRRLMGTGPRLATPSPRRKLNTQEEAVLIQWILDMDSRGYAPRVSDVSRKADLLLAERVRGTTTLPDTVGKNWATKFVSRCPELKSAYSRKYDYQRALCEDPKVIREWFRLVQNTKTKYGILDEDIWNFDETGFQMGVISTAKIVTGTERRAQPRLVQPGDREWVTAIEAVCASGEAIEPLIIFSGKVHQTSWFKELDTLGHRWWNLAVSPTGWSNDELGLQWLRDVFDKQTKGKTCGAYRLLILDGHHSHNTPEFKDYCDENNIITLYMPPHASHLLQPLDVACYSPLKKYYGAAVERLIRNSQHHVEKVDFLGLYGYARLSAMTEKNIKSGFSAAGLVPSEPDAVLDKLDILIRTPTPTPPPSSVGSNGHFQPTTPRNIRQIETHTRTLKKRLRKREINSASPTSEAVLQLAKTAEQSTLALRIAHERIIELESHVKIISRRRRTKRTYIKNAGVLRAVDVDISQVEEEEEGDSDTIIIATSATSRRCGRCKATGHNSRTCTQQ